MGQSTWEEKEPSSAQSEERPKHQPHANHAKKMNATVMKSRTARIAPRQVKGVRSVAVRATRKSTVMASKMNQMEKLQAALVVSAAGASSSPLIPAAEAASVSPSLKNLLSSVVAGGAVLGGIAVALSTVSRFDRTNRN